MSRATTRVWIGALAVGAACWLGAAASAATPPNFDVNIVGPVGFGIDPVACPGGFVITADAPARGTHIGGRGTFTATECATPDYATGINHVSGTAVLTSTDGAQIFITYGGTSPLPDIVTGEIGEDLGFTITGGTGRFAGASGGGRQLTHGNFYVAVFGEFIGTISMNG